MFSVTFPPVIERSPKDCRSGENKLDPFRVRWRSGSPIDRSEVARHLIRRLDHWYQASRCNGVEVLNLPWRTRSEHLGRFVRITTSAGAMSGRLVEIDLRTGLTLSVADDAPRSSSEQGMPQLVRLAMGDVLTLEEVSIGLSEHDPSDVGGVGVTMPAS